VTALQQLTEKIAWRKIRPACGRVAGRMIRSHVSTKFSKNQIRRRSMLLRARRPADYTRDYRWFWVESGSVVGFASA